MPYEYRKMSLEERERTLQTRKETGSPFHTPPHLLNAFGKFMISAACFEHAQILSTPQRLDGFEKRILALTIELKITLDAWTILPIHYHILTGDMAGVWIPSFIKKLHTGSSFEWNREDGCQGKRKVWFQYFDRLIVDEEQYFKSLNYIHLNPVRHGLVKNVYD